MEDAEILYQNFGLDFEMVRYSGWNPYATKEAAEEAVSRFINSYEDEHFYGWAIDYEGGLIGTVGAYDFDLESQSVEIGCSIQRAYWGKGFASEAINAVIDYLVRDEGIKCVKAWCAAENVGSRRIMEKAGMRCISVEKDALEINGMKHDKLNYIY